MGESYPNVEEYLVSLENIRSVQWDIWGRFWTTKTKKSWIVFHIGKHFLSSINNHSCNIILFFHKCPKKYRALHLNVVFEFELHNFTEFIDISQFWGWFDKWCPFSKKSVGLWDWKWWWRCTCALCGYPIVKMEIRDSSPISTTHSFYFCLIISDRNIWRLPAVQFHFLGTSWTQSTAAAKFSKSQLQFKQSAGRMWIIFWGRVEH